MISFPCAAPFLVVASALSPKPILLGRAALFYLYAHGDPCLIPSPCYLGALPHEALAALRAYAQVYTAWAQRPTSLLSLYCTS